MKEVKKEIIPYEYYSKTIRLLGKEPLPLLYCPLCKNELELNLDMCCSTPWHFHCKNRECSVAIHCTELPMVTFAIPYITKECPDIELRDNKVIYWE